MCKTSAWSVSDIATAPTLTSSHTPTLHLLVASACHRALQGGQCMGVMRYWLVIMPLKGTHALQTSSV